jgi:hypothetical protein
VGFLPREDRARNPTYWAICRGIASRPQLLELADLVPPPQFGVNVLLAAVHDLLLAGASHELAAHYRSVALRRGLEFRALDDSALIELFEAFCQQFRDEIAVRCATRRTQTNEVGRCAAARAALCSVATDRPLALLDVGCSAGLNLFVDAYSYAYGTTVLAGVEGAPVLHCELLGATPPLELPRIASRTGLDVAPIEVTDPDEMRWLLALVWPDDVGRFERLLAATDVAAARRSEVAFVQGDMVESLAAASELADPESHLVVLTMWSTAYLPTSRRHAFSQEVARLASTRDLTWIVMEHPTVAHELGVLSHGGEYRHRGASVVCMTRYHDGVESSALVAETHAHGLWLDWHEGATSTR